MEPTKETATKFSEAITKELHPQAVKLYQERVSEFSKSLLLQSKLLAYRRNDDIVLSNHIDEAHEMIQNERNRKWSRELLIILGSAFFGTFIQGFISELSNGRTILAAGYTVLGFVGMFLVFLGLSRR